MAARRAWRLCVRARSIELINRRSYYCIPDRVDRGFVDGSEVRPFLRSFDAHASTSSSIGKWNKKCWSCGAPAPSNVFMLCSKCTVIQPADSTLNHFDIFGIERNFELDTSLLEKRYKDLQKRLHPDLYSMKSEKEQGFSADQASQVINGYQTLLHPLPRATYLLETLGVDVEEAGTVEDPEILMEVMEMQEAISDCSDASQLRAVQSKAQSRMRDYERCFIQAMKKPDLKAAEEAVQRMCYFDRILKTIIQKL